VRGENPVFSEERNELVAMLIEDVMDFSDCQFWDEMKDSELEDWYTWSTLADSYPALTMISGSPRRKIRSKNQPIHFPQEIARIGCCGRLLVS
jgi:hypothetical protein